MDGFDLPVGEGDAALALIAIVVAVIVLIVAGPFLWIVVLFIVEMLWWILLAVASVAAWLLVGRPWQVVVANGSGTAVAASAVRGRRRAHEHAAVVERRLANGASPTVAVAAP